MALTILDLSDAKAALLERSIPGKRLMAPTNMSAIVGGGGYGGFQSAKMGRLTADWSTMRSSADQTLQFGLAPLRARARERAINSPLASKFLQMLRTNLIGSHGIRINFMVEKQRKRGDEIQDEDTNDELRRAWKKWCRKEYCTVHGRYTWTDVLNLAADAAGRDGDFLVRKVYVPKSQNPFGFSLQLVDADQLKESLNRIADVNQNQIRMGVEVDQYQKPIAYHCYKGNPSEAGNSSEVTRVPANQMYHWFIPRRIGQTRGYPLLAPVLWDMNMLDKYFDAELTAARAGAQMFGTIEQKEDDEGYEGDGQNEDGTTQLELSNGTLTVLPPGQTLNNATPEHPTAAFSPFVERSLRLIASGLGVAYHELGNDLAGVNFSSGRLGVLEERDYWKELQTSLISTICRPVYEDWVRSALLNRAVDLPFDPDRFTDDEVIQFIPRRWTWVDPLKDVQASVDSIQNGFTTHEQVLHEQGKDWRDVFKQIKAERDYADQLGIVLGTDIRGDALSEENDGPAAAPDGTETDPPPTKPAGGKKPAAKKPPKQ